MFFDRLVAKFGVIAPLHSKLDFIAVSSSSPNSQLEDDLKRGLSEGSILYYEPDYLNDPFTLQYIDFGLLAQDYEERREAWWLEAINLPSAFSLLQGRNDLQLNQSVNPPIVAVLDSGVDTLHPALKGKIWENPYPGQAGCRDDRFGCDTTQHSKGWLGFGGSHPWGTGGGGESCPVDPDDPEQPDGNCMHGTHVAGIISGDWQEGVLGICPVCQILPIKVVETIHGQPKVADSSILRALQYIRNLKRQQGLPIKIINSSFGKFHKSKILSLVIDSLSRGDDLVLVGAAGNENAQQPVFPAAEESVLAVAALGPFGDKARYSNFGRWVDVSAPGGDLRQGGKRATILSAVPGGEVGFSQGTSMAAPMVSAALGLLQFQHPQLSAQELKKRLIEASSPALYSKSFAGGLNYEYFYPLIRPEKQRKPLLGAGLLDIRALLNGEQLALYEYPQSNRLKIGCGAVDAIGSGEISYSAHLIVWFVLAIPILVCFFRGAYDRRQDH